MIPDTRQTKTNGAFFAKFVYFCVFSGCSVGVRRVSGRTGLGRRRLSASAGRLHRRLRPQTVSRWVIFHSNFKNCAHRSLRTEKSNNCAPTLTEVQGDHAIVFSVQKNVKLLYMRRSTTRCRLDNLDLFPERPVGIWRSDAIKSFWFCGRRRVISDNLFLASFVCDPNAQTFDYLVPRAWKIIPGWEPVFARKHIGRLKITFSLWDFFA